jgi:hypothetical protein
MRRSQAVLQVSASSGTPDALTPDAGTPERRRKTPHVLEDLPEGGQRVRVQADPLDRYLARGEVTGRQAQAALWMRALWHRCHFESGLTMRWEQRVDGSRGAEADRVSDGALSARMKYRKAVQAVGIRLSDALIRIICEGVSARDWAVATRRHPSAGIDLFRLALDELADFLGLPADAAEKEAVKKTAENKK